MRFTAAASRFDRMLPLSFLLFMPVFIDKRLDISILFPFQTKKEFFLKKLFFLLISRKQALYITILSKPA